MRSVVNDHSCFQISIEDSILSAQVYSEEYDYFCLYNSDAASTFLMNSIDYNLRQRLSQVQQESDSFSVLWLRLLQMVQPTSVNHFEIIKQKLVSLKPTKYANENLEELINEAKTYSCFVHGIVISQQFHLNKGYLSSYCSTTGGVRAVHVSTAKFIHTNLDQFLINTGVHDMHSPNPLPCTNENRASSMSRVSLIIELAE